MGLAHALPLTNVISDESPNVGGVLRALENKTVLPAVGDVPYATVTYLLSYAFVAGYLALALPFFGFDLASLKEQVIDNLSSIYLVTRGSSAVLAIIAAALLCKFSVQFLCCWFSGGSAAVRVSPRTAILRRNIQILACRCCSSSCGYGHELAKYSRPGRHDLIESGSRRYRSRRHVGFVLAVFKTDGPYVPVFACASAVCERYPRPGPALAFDHLLRGLPGSDQCSGALGQLG